ncbi:MAG: hypothetical protein ACE5FN_00810 [Leptospirillia bacterium]
MNRHGVIKPMGAMLAGLAAAVLAFTSPAHAIQLTPDWDLKGKFFADVTSSERDDDSGFHLKRAYVMLRGKLADGAKFGLTLDQRSEASAGGEGVFVKHAYLSKSYKGILYTAGLHGTPYVPWDEKHFWGYRFVENTFTDEWGAQTSSDLGVSAQGTGMQGKLDYHVALLNGEGYGNSTDGNGFAFAGRANIQIDALTVGLFLHDENHRNGVRDFDPNRQVVFAFYETDTFRFGGQLMMLDDGTGAGTVYDDGDGYNLQGHYKLPKMTNAHVFARYDSIDIGTNAANADRSLWIVGLAKKVGENLTIAPNVKEIDNGTVSNLIVGLHTQYTF